MIISDLFKVEYGQRFYHSKGFLDDKIGKIPLISSGRNEHGFYGTFNIKPIYKNVISVTNTGSIGWAFYHNYNCCIDDNCLVLIPKTKISDQQMIYISMLINKDKYRYMYGRQVTPARIESIELPNIPDFVDEKEFPDVEKVKKSASNKKLSLSDRKWKWFELDSLFPFERGKCGSAEKLLEKGNGISYIGAKKENNGLMYKVVRDENYVTKSNCIVFIGDGQGSVGYSTYQENDFIGSTTLSMGRNKNLNKYNALFIITLLDKERFKYSFGRKWNGEKLKNTKIKLPVDKNGNPDWQFMENYIKSLPYSSSI
ncbi:MAG: restriction endonuclease subunit S [Candidatus Berkelbacteria bacterium]|nr:restriction endonuclease subunit S [Candidatus Berkelbacteria bacterium]